MECFVTDKHNMIMTMTISEKLKIIEPNTYEECFPFEEKIVFCYFKGTFQNCQEFIDKQHLDVQRCLEIDKI
jgi:capsule polysaccharide modification protein KpsS